MTALDSDRLAVEATLGNARDNGVALEDVRRSNLRGEPAPAADVVTANLMRPLLLRVAELMDEPPDALVVSGLLEHEADEVSGAFGRHGLVESRRLADRGWTAVRLAAVVTGARSGSVRD